MRTYEEMIIKADEEGIEVIEMDFKGNAKGYCCDNVISISNKLTTNKEKKCTLIEEISHLKNNIGNILDQSDIRNRKQERLARTWGYEKLVGIIDLVSAYNNGVRNRYELSEYLDVTEEFIDSALKYYKEKYGLFYEIDNYIVYFEPLVIIKKF
ncbi:ImmA/IrrE family metallo-endopeptidase [Alkaliphilus sp. B6464]|uniref:ImmA/IrrE family metallo-endopeptidase n=1 Tax=Alkaliphilus sp. B6464 TaxID=2731219 RepID=UPI001BABE407|nr:ImmA/IrrE family metallo-endopeptidase [Alkaliphilus sp. B6464]QUH21463.1 hypothetical protein HYG84_17280 [Alkaliphilus sp. B6464]